MINLQIIDKNQKVSNANIVHMTLKGKTIKNLIDKIREHNWSYENKPTIIEFEESQKALSVSGDATVGPESYLEIINITKTILDMLKNKDIPNSIGFDMLTEYHQNGCNTIPNSNTIINNVCYQSENNITLWVDRINKQNAVIIFRIGSIIVPFSLNDYLFLPHYTKSVKEFKQIIEKYKIPYIFGTIYEDEKDLGKYIKDMREHYDKMPEDTFGVEEKINTKPRIMYWIEENEDLIILLGLKERYRQSEMSLKSTIAHIKHSLENI